MVETHKNKLLEIVRFSNLSNENEDNIPANMKYLWDDILSNHPTTKNIFLKGKGFDIQHKSTYKKIIDKLNSLDLSHTEYDVLGNAYEEVIQDIMTGKVLGQFFTQPLVKKMMVKLIDPQIHPDGKIDTCGDPAMGTGGFLIGMTVFCVAWLSWNSLMPSTLQFDPRLTNFTLLTLILSMQASYAAPLILLAQNRQDDRDRVKANILARFFGDPTVEGNFPRPFGVFYQSQRATHDDLINAQVNRAKEAFGAGDLDKLLSGRNTWTIA
jgi:hypothetical protein